MSLDLRPTSRLTLQQRMTPQLIHLMQLLTLPSQELRSEVDEALTDNPALEEVPDDEDGVGGDMAEAAGSVPGAPETITGRTGLADVEWAQGPHPLHQSDEVRLLEHLDGGVGSDLVRIGLELEPEDDDPGFRERSAPRSTGLAEHLLEQLREEFDDAKSRSIGEWIIGNLDASGYLCEDVPAIAGRLAVEPEDVVRVLHRIQTFDPIGSAARDGRECLRIQARIRFPDRPHLVSLIEHHLPALKERLYPAIARALGVTVKDVLEDEKRLVVLNPKPARGFGEDSTVYITPDVYIFKVGEDFLVRLNDDGLPKLRVSPYYRQILRSARAAGPEELAFVRAKVTAAKWFVKSIYERQQTILKVTEAIVRRQREFFNCGKGYLKPMALRDIASDIGMSESTVSRATSRKYADTPQGVLELKYLFDTGVRTANGIEVATESVRKMIGRMITLEDPRRPLSDQQVVSRLLSDHGVMMARRTVAKYREELRIFPARRRHVDVHRRGDPTTRGPVACVAVSSVAVIGGGTTPTFVWAPVRAIRGPLHIRILEHNECGEGDVGRVAFAADLTPAATRFTVPSGVLRAGRLYALAVEPRRTRLPEGVAVLPPRFFEFAASELPVRGDLPVALPWIDRADAPAARPAYRFDLEVIQGDMIFLDPVRRFGYDYATGSGDPNFAAVLLPACGWGPYDLWLFDRNGVAYDTGLDLQEDREFDLTTGLARFGIGPEGVAQFRVHGTADLVDVAPPNPIAFPTGLRFVASGRFTGTMTPLLEP